MDLSRAAKKPAANKKTAVGVFDWVGLQPACSASELLNFELWKYMYSL